MVIRVERTLDLLSELCQEEYSFPFLPSATVVAERLCFHRCLSVHRGGGVHTPLGRHPLGRHTPPGRHPPGGHCSGRYASYWNAFLLGNVEENVIKHYIITKCMPLAYLSNIESIRN